MQPPDTDVNSQYTMKTVAFILSLGHSGSTLLGHFLGSHSRMLHIGEIVSPLRKGKPVRCHLCGEQPCPVWDKAVDSSFIEAYYQTYHKDVSSSCTRLRRGLWRLKKKLGHNPSPGELYRRLFEAMPDVKIIVDGNKKVRWAEWNRNDSLYRSVYLFLVRDLRAVVASIMRRERASSVSEAANMCVAALEDIRHFVDERDPKNTITIHYEKMATDPDGVGKRLCAFLGVDWAPQMLEYYRFRHHVFGGNLAPTLQVRDYHDEGKAKLLTRLKKPDRQYYADHELGFKLDERWKEEFSDELLAEFEVIGGKLNRELAYGG